MIIRYSHTPWFLALACVLIQTACHKEMPAAVLPPAPPQPTLHLSSAQMQTMTPRASDALSGDPQCTLLDFEWQELERALQDLPATPEHTLVEAVQAQLPRETCRGQRQALLVLGGLSDQDRAALLSALPAWYPQRAGEDLSASTMLQIEPESRAPVLEFSRTCGNLSQYGEANISAAEWPALLRGLRSLTAFERRHQVQTDKCSVLLHMRAPDRDRAVRSALRLLPSSYPVLQKETDSQGHYLHVLLTALGSVPLRPAPGNPAQRHHPLQRSPPAAGAYAQHRRSLRRLHATHSSRSAVKPSLAAAFPANMHGYALESSAHLRLRLALHLAHFCPRTPYSGAPLYPRT